MIVHAPGVVPYEEALAQQRASRARVLAGGEDQLWLLEHPPVVTLGRRGGLVDRALLDALATPVIETDRGGLATWHGPGQLVGYPVVDLARASTDVPRFVRRLGALMEALAEGLGLRETAYDDARPGLYRDGRKLGSIGLHIHKGVTLHGFALNLDVDLRGFQAIVPCGLAGLRVSSVSLELGRPATVAQALALARDLAPRVLYEADPERPGRPHR